MTEYRFLEPLDVLHLRGNRLFGDPGAHGEALMPPWPSLAAGAMRSRMLADGGVDLHAYAKGRCELKEPLQGFLGTPDCPGSFRVSFFTLGQRDGDDYHICFSIPSDLAVQTTGAVFRSCYAVPAKMHSGLKCSYSLSRVPVLGMNELHKAERGLWLNHAGVHAYLAGEKILPDHIISRSELWRVDPRLGIALDNATRTAMTGRIYTSEAVALREDVGFILGIQGADGFVPKDGLLRFGGDGRGANIRQCGVQAPEPPWDRIHDEKRFRITLATPGAFEAGWVIPGSEDTSEDKVWHGPEFRARLIGAAVGRHEVVSGWDISKQRPKTAVRVAPVGSVYWFDNFEGDVNGLKKLLVAGLWDLGPNRDAVRRAEGFNNVMVAAWPGTHA